MTTRPKIDSERRRLLHQVVSAAVATAAAGGALAASTAPSPRTGTASRGKGDDDKPHKIVYQLNKADPEYIEHILNSVAAMLSKYPEEIAIAVVCFGPGIHLVARKPQRPIPAELRRRAKGQAEFYGVRYIACGNTMKTLGWGPEAIEPFATIEEVGAAALMELQEAGYAYLAW